MLRLNNVGKVFHFVKLILLFHSSFRLEVSVVHASLHLILHVQLLLLIIILLLYSYIFSRALSAWSKIQIKKIKKRRKFGTYFFCYNYSFWPFTSLYNYYPVGFIIYCIPPILAETLFCTYYNFLWKFGFFYFRFIWFKPFLFNLLVVAIFELFVMLPPDGGIGMLPPP